MRGKKAKVTREMISEFWKYGINPITGFKKETIQSSKFKTEVPVPLKYKHLI